MAAILDSILMLRLAINEANKAATTVWPCQRSTTSHCLVSAKVAPDHKTANSLLCYHPVQDNEFVATGVSHQLYTSCDDSGGTEVPQHVTLQPDHECHHESDVCSTRRDGNRDCITYSIQ